MKYNITDFTEPKSRWVNKPTWHGFSFTFPDLLIWSIEFLNNSNGINLTDENSYNCLMSVDFFKLYMMVVYVKYPFRFCTFPRKYESNYFRLLEALKATWVTLEMWKLKPTNFIWRHFFFLKIQSTVKPEYNDSTSDPKIVVVVDSLSLFGGGC